MLRLADFDLTFFERFYAAPPSALSNRSQSEGMLREYFSCFFDHRLLDRKKSRRGKCMENSNLLTETTNKKLRNGSFGANLNVYDKILM